MLFRSSVTSFNPPRRPPASPVHSLRWQRRRRKQIDAIGAQVGTEAQTGSSTPHLPTHTHTLVQRWSGRWGGWSYVPCPLSLWLFLGLFLTHTHTHIHTFTESWQAGSTWEHMCGTVKHWKLGVRSMSSAAVDPKGNTQEALFLTTVWLTHPHTPHTFTHHSH